MNTLYLASMPFYVQNIHSQFYDFQSNISSIYISINPEVIIIIINYTNFFVDTSCSMQRKQKVNKLKTYYEWLILLAAFPLLLVSIPAQTKLAYSGEWTHLSSHLSGTSF